MIDIGRDACIFMLLGGGGFSEKSDDLRLESFALKYLIDHPRPNVCFIPTASADSEDYIKKFYRAFAQLNANTYVLSLLISPPDDLESFIEKMDVLYIGGGNTKNLLAVWKDWKLDIIIKEKFILRRNKLIIGISAGSSCWFSQCYTDSFPNRLTVMDALGIIRGLFNPHHENARAESFCRLKSQFDDCKYGAGDDVAFIYKSGELLDIVTTKTVANFFISPELNKENIQPVYLAD